MSIEPVQPAAGQSRVDLLFSEGDFDPEMITSRLQLVPTHKGLKGEAMRGGYPRPWSVWQFSLDSAGESEASGEVLSRMVELLRTKEDSILSIIQDTNCQCAARITYWIDSSTLGFACESSDLLFLARICNSLSVDHVIIRES